MSPDPTVGSVGSVGSEAAALLEALQDWARRTFGEGQGAHMATGAPECEWCPLCQLVSVLRGDRPETTDKIMAAGSALLSALRSISDPAQTPGQSSSSGSHSRPEAPQAHRVQHIDLGTE